ncbi:MAG: S8 family serine peptidase [Lachnospiraceae bacterium]|nr:S8 family serine peptidase [Lachnospiraceae bacterium]
MRYQSYYNFKRAAAVIMTAALLCANSNPSLLHAEENQTENEKEPEFTANELLTPMGKKDEIELQSTALDEQTVFIVKLEGESRSSNSDIISDSVYEHDEIYNKISNAVTEEVMESSDFVIQAVSDSVERVADYYNLFNGMAISAPASSKEAILSVDGVSAVYQEKTFILNAEEISSGSEEDLGFYTCSDTDDGIDGSGQVIAVFDSALRTDHEAFATEPEDPKFSEEYIEDAKDKLGEGNDGLYISSKIPFVYDYADKDNDVEPSGDTAFFDRGTHIASTAAGNCENFKGSAPGAQIVFCKIVPDWNKVAAETDIFSALDDCLELGVDQINMSFTSALPSFGAELSSALWSDIFDKLSDKGIIVNAAAGRSAYEADQIPSSMPDSGNISGPASFERCLAVAGVYQADGESRSENSMDEESSWGPTPELSLKPDIAAPLGIVSASDDSESDYSAMDGIFDSSALVAGYCAQIREYIEKNDNDYFTGISDEEKRKRIIELLMSTAEPQTDSDTGLFISPRLQGAGLANVSAALSSKVYATVENAANEEFVKAELGDNSERNGKFKFTITLHNMSDTDKTYTPSTSVLSEEVEDDCFKGKDFDLKDDNYASVSYTGDAYEDGEIFVEANDEASFTVTVNIKNDFEDWIDENAVNGAYVEGYCILEDSDDDEAVNLTVPYLGFYGDWGKIEPVFDERIDSENEPILKAETYINANTGYPLGINPLLPVCDEDFDDSELTPDLDKLVISNSYADCAPTIFLPQTTTLRNAASMVYEYRNANNELSEYYSEDYLEKSGESELTGFCYTEDNMISKPVFDGYCSNEDDGLITLKKKLLTAGPSSERYEETVDFYYDTTKPEMGELSYSGKDESCAVSFTATDNYAIAGISLGDPDTGELFYSQLSEEGGTEESFNIKIADATEKWVELNESYDLPLSVVLTVWDYGLNYKSAKLNFASVYQTTNSKYGLSTEQITGFDSLYVNVYSYVPYFGNRKVINAADLGLSLQYGDISLEPSEIKLITEYSSNYDGVTSCLSVYLKGVKPLKTRSASEKSAIRKAMKELVKELKDLSIAEIIVYPRMIQATDKISKVKEAKEENSVYYIVNQKGDNIKSVKAVVITHKPGGGTKRTVLKLKEDVDYFSSKNKIYFEGYQVQGTVKIN